MQPFRARGFPVEQLESADTEVPEDALFGFLDQIELEDGPHAQLGSFFVRAFVEAQACGVTLEFVNLETLVETNARNRDSWATLVPIFDPQYGGADDANCICVAARNSDGKIVCMQAIRLLDVATDLCEATESLELFYGIHAPRIRRETSETWSVRGAARASMQKMSGRIAFSGAAWCHPAQRGGYLTRLLVRVCRVYGLTRWRSPFTVAYMAEAVVRGGFAAKCGHRHIEWDIDARNCAVGTSRVALLWLDNAEAWEEMHAFLRSPPYNPSVAINRRA